MIGIPEFIEEYNKRMDWNQDILGYIDDAYLSAHPFMKEIADKYLSTGKITEETYDIDNAKIYEYDDEEDYGLLELHAQSKSTYRLTYFWMDPNEDEEQYKAKKIERVLDVLKKSKDEVVEKIKAETKKLNDIEELSYAIKNSLTVQES